MNNNTNNNFLCINKNEHCMKRQRNYSIEAICDESNEYQNLLNNFNHIDINNTNNELLQKLVTQINDLEIIVKKNSSNYNNFNPKNLIDEIDKLNIKMDKIHKNIEKSLVEKEYVIENLQNELNILKDELKTNISEKRDNDYFC
jgi:hypothetical protein